MEIRENPRIDIDAVLNGGNKVTHLFQKLCDNRRVLGIDIQIDQSQYQE